MKTVEQYSPVVQVCVILFFCFCFLFFCFVFCQNLDALRKALDLDDSLPLSEMGANLYFHGLQLARCI